MQLQLIRNATLRLDFAGKTLLYDPMLGPAGSLPSYAGVAANPLVDLPREPGAVLRGVDGVILTHLHGDHFDEAARERLPRDLPVLAQPEDAPQLRDWGFTNVLALEDAALWQGLEVRRLPARHGSSPGVLADMGPVSGFFLRAEGEPGLYLSGDTIWYPELEAALKALEPNVAVTHSGGAVWGEERELILMDHAQTAAACRALPASFFVAVHLEALDHCTTTRARLRRTLEAACPGRFAVPEDGETITIA
ncbi:MBL fold metallo-hydrolase [Oceanithermus sp.]